MHVVSVCLYLYIYTHDFQKIHISLDFRSWTSRWEPMLDASKNGPSRWDWLILVGSMVGFLSGSWCLRCREIDLLKSHGNIFFLFPKMKPPHCVIFPHKSKEVAVLVIGQHCGISHQVVEKTWSDTLGSRPLKKHQDRDSRYHFGEEFVSSHQFISFLSALVDLIWRNDGWWTILFDLCQVWSLKILPFAFKICLVDDFGHFTSQKKYWKKVFSPSK